MMRTPEEARRIYDAYYEDLKKKAIAQARMPALIAELRAYLNSPAHTWHVIDRQTGLTTRDVIHSILDRYDDKETS